MIMSVRRMYALKLEEKRKALEAEKALEQEPKAVEPKIEEPKAQEKKAKK